MQGGNSRSEGAVAGRSDRGQKQRFQSRGLALIARRHKEVLTGEYGTVSLGRLYRPDDVKGGNLATPDVVDEDPDSIPFNIHELDKTHIRGLHRQFGGGSSYAVYRRIMFDDLMRWARDAHDSVISAVRSFYPDIDDEIIKKTALKSLLRLSYVLCSLAVRGDVHLPSAMCAILDPTTERMCFTGPLSYGEDYFIVKCDGVALDFSSIYSHPCSIVFPGDSVPDGILYRHLTLKCHLRLGTPVRHDRVAIKGSVMNDARGVSEYRAAPYKFNPRSYVSAFDMYIYPVSLCRDIDCRVINARIYHPHLIEGMSAQDISNIAKSLPIADIIRDGKYVFPAMWEDELGEMDVDDQRTVAEYFHT